MFEFKDTGFITDEANVDKGRQEAFVFVDYGVLDIFIEGFSFVWFPYIHYSYFTVQILGLHASLMILRMKGNLFSQFENSFYEIHFVLPF